MLAQGTEKSNKAEIEFKGNRKIMIKKLKIITEEPQERSYTVVQSLCCK